MNLLKVKGHRDFLLSKLPKEKDGFKSSSTVLKESI